MADAAGALIVGAAAAGAVWLWKDYQKRQAETTDATLPNFAPYMNRDTGGGFDPFAYNGGQQSGIAGPRFDAAPLIGWGFDTLLAALDGRNTGAGQTPPIVDNGGNMNATKTIFGNLFGSGATAGAGGATAGAGSSGATAGGGVSALLDLIGRAEAPQGYNQVWGGSRIQPPRPITTMTVGEVMDWQRRSVAAGSYSSAAGRYQVINPTLSDMVAQGVVSSSDRFDGATQDRIAVALMRRRGLDKFQQGQMSAESFGNNLAKEWAGLPVLTGSKAGRSYYAQDGVNGATVSRQAVFDALGGWV